MSFLHSSGLSLLFTATLMATLAGCASTQTPAQNQAARSAAVGTWEYRVTGAAPLNRGTFSVGMQNGRLQVTVTDRYRGRLTATVRVSPSQMELNIGPYRISGDVDGNRFSGFVRLNEYDVSIPYRRVRSSSDTRSAFISAKRVQRPPDAGRPSAIDCRSILREASGCR